MFLNNASSSLKADCVHDVFTQYFVKIFTFFFFAEGGFLPVVLHWSQPANPNTDRTTSYIGRASIHLFKTGRENEIESLAWIADTKCCVTSSLVHPNETVIITSLSCLKSHDKSTVAARYPTLKKEFVQDSWKCNPVYYSSLTVPMWQHVLDFVVGAKSW